LKGLKKVEELKRVEGVERGLVSTFKYFNFSTMLLQVNTMLIISAFLYV